MSKAKTGLRSRFMLRAAALRNEGKTNPEIAEELGIETSQVGYLLHQARKAGFNVPKNISFKQREKRRAEA